MVWLLVLVTESRMANAILVYQNSWKTPVVDAELACLAMRDSVDVENAVRLWAVPSVVAARQLLRPSRSQLWLRLALATVSSTPSAFVSDRAPRAKPVSWLRLS